MDQDSAKGHGDLFRLCYRRPSCIEGPQLSIPGARPSVYWWSADGGFVTAVMVVLGMLARRLEAADRQVKQAVDRIGGRLPRVA